MEVCSDYYHLYVWYPLLITTIIWLEIHLQKGVPDCQKVIGAHHIWGNADISVDQNGKYTMKITINEIDKYNFNKGMSDIVTGSPDNENGCFAVLGWAKSFMTYGKLVRVVTWNAGEIGSATNITKTNT